MYSFFFFFLNAIPGFCAATAGAILQLNTIIMISNTNFIFKKKILYGVGYICFILIYYFFMLYLNENKYHLLIFKLIAEIPHFIQYGSVLYKNILLYNY